MNTDNQIRVLRIAYMHVWRRLYDLEFQFKLAALSQDDPEWYSKKMKIIHAVIAIIE